MYTVSCDVITPFFMVASLHSLLKQELVGLRGHMSLSSPTALGLIVLPKRSTSSVWPAGGRAGWVREKAIACLAD